MKLPQFGVSKPVTVVMLFLAFLLIGAYSLFRLPVDLFPEIDPPVITVIISWPGAGTADVEDKVTEVAENQLAIVSGLDELRSTSKEGVSSIQLKFAWGTNLDEASNEVRDRLAFAAAFLPDDIDSPIIFKFNTSMIPVIFYGVMAETNWNNVYDIADDQIAKELQRIPGVGSVLIVGGRKRQINIFLDRDKLDARNVSLSEIVAAIREANLTQPAGSVKVDRTKFTIRIPGEFKTPGEIERIIVKTDGGAAVYVEDLVAEPITLGFVERTQVVKVDGRDAMWVVVQKRSGANTVSVVKDIRARMEEIRSRLPKDVTVQELFDTSSFIESSLSNLTGTVVIGGVLVIIVTLLFLRNIRSSFVIAVTIPFSLIIAFIFLYLFNFTINIISLASIAIAIGMVVDNSIVVLENVMRRIEDGEKVLAASVFGTSEVGTAITASTLTTIVVFVPLIFLTGIVGIFFKQLALAVSVTIAASLFCALLLAPMLCSKLLRPAEQMVPRWPLARRFYVASENGFKRVESAYSSSLRWALAHKGWVLALAGLALVLSFSLMPLIGSEFMPAQDTGDLNIYFRMKVGTRVEQTELVARRLDEILREVGGKDVVHIFQSSGESEGGLSSAFGGQEGSHIGRVGAKLVSIASRSRRTEDIGQAVIERLKKTDMWPDVEKIFLDTGNPLDRLLLMGAGQPISIEILGYDLNKSYEVAQKIQKIVADTPGGRNPTISLELGKPELQVIVDKEKASDVGLNEATVADIIDTLYRGSTASTYRRGSLEYDIKVRYAAAFRQDIQAILDAVIPTPDGKEVVLGTIADVKEVLGPVAIDRKNRQRVVRVEASAYKRSAGDVVSDVERGIAKLRADGTIPPGFSVEQAGATKEQRESFRDLAMLLVMGIILVFMVMASQFESGKLSLVVMFSIPFAFSGVIAFLAMTGTTLNLMSFIGVILLVGVVVNNAIVLIDYTNILRARGYSMLDAVRTAGSRRLRPVLMTALTTIFGTIPLAVSPGEGSETWQPVGVTVIGGMLVSTLVTLILIPTIYSIVERKGEKAGGEN